jgi:hypothetical protein
VNRPTKKEIKAAVDKLKDGKADNSRVERDAPKLEAGKSNMRIRKRQGI